MLLSACSAENASAKDVLRNARQSLTTEIRD
jgi:hypothetical protein